TVVPKGYYPPDGEVHISVGDNKVIAELIKDGTKTKEFEVTGTGTEAEPYVVTITNSTGAALPSTGGHGTLPYTLCGLLMVLGSALMLGLRRKSKITV
ncbi:MAG: LPXTG cell wall anchor domain-containing protein, partial [Firmicutes bacterium]|nr:LPXTG cell wall anchor domain-containing protein [Bacillota bacterium]